MVWLTRIERYFWIFIAFGVISGFLFPSFLRQFEEWVIYIVMAIMGLLFLKVDILHIVTHMRKPGLLLYVAFFNLIVVPLALFYTFFRFLDPTLATGLLLLAALPSGVSSAVFTDIMKGKTSLSLTLVIVTNLLSPLTIPFIFWLTFHRSLELDYSGLMLKLAFIIFIPFLIATLLKKAIIEHLDFSLEDYYNPVILVLLSMMIMISISYQSEFIVANFNSLLGVIGLLFVCFFIFHILGYFSVFWLKKMEKLAISNSKMIVNNILGIVLAIAFFDVPVATLIILSLIPWGIMIIAKNWYKQYLP